MYTLFKIELYKIFKRPRTYISFGAMAALICIIQVGLKFDGKEYIEFVLAEFSKTSFSFNCTA